MYPLNMLWHFYKRKVLQTLKRKVLQTLLQVIIIIKNNIFLTFSWIQLPYVINERKKNLSYFLPSTKEASGSFLWSPSWLYFGHALFNGSWTKAARYTNIEQTTIADTDHADSDYIVGVDFMPYSSRIKAHY